MKTARLWMALGCLGAAVLASSGCSIMRCSGSGPLQYSQLGDWAGIEPPAAPAQADRNEILLALTDVVDSPELGQRTSVGDATDPLMRGLAIKEKFRGIGPFTPGERRSDMLIYAQQAATARTFYGLSDGWGVRFLIGDLLYSKYGRSVYDASTGEKAGAVRTEMILPPVGWIRRRLVRPVNVMGDGGLRIVVDPARPIADTRYEVKDNSILLLGLFGWGRANDKWYIQVLWVPIPVGTVSLPKD